MKAEITNRLLEAIEKGKHPEFGPFPPAKEVEVRDLTTKGFSVIVFPSGTMTFCYRYRNKEGRARKYTIGKWGANKTVKVARDAADQAAARVTLGSDVHETDKQKRVVATVKRQRTLGVFFEAEYKPYCLTHMKRGDVRIQMLKSCFVDDWGDLPLTDINNWKVMQWRKKKLEGGRKPAAVNRPVSGLKALLNRAVEWNLIDKNPLTLTPISEDKNPVTRFLSDLEEKRLRAALDRRQEKQKEERRSYIKWQEARYIDPLPDLTTRVFSDYLKPLILVALNTGCRRGELFSLQVKDLDFKRRHITLVGSNTKSGNSRFIPMTEESFHVLTTWLNESRGVDYVFSSPVTGSRLDNIKISWTALLKNAAIENFRFHDLRHSFASKLVMKGADLYTVKEFLGHASIETTQRYAHLAPEHKAKAIELLNT